MTDDLKKWLKAASFGLNAFSMGLSQLAKNIESLAESQTTAPPDQDAPVEPPPEVKSKPATKETPAPEPKPASKKTPAPEPKPASKKTPAPEPKTKKTAASRPNKKKQSGADIILEIIANSKNGVDINTVAEKTGFTNRKISDAVHRLKRQNKVKSLKPGVYVTT